MAKTKIKRIGILTAGGDSPGLNAAIRGVGKTCLTYYGMEILGFRDGFRGLGFDEEAQIGARGGVVVFVGGVLPVLVRHGVLPVVRSDGLVGAVDE